MAAYKEKLWKTDFSALMNISEDEFLQTNVLEIETCFLDLVEVVPME